MAFIDYIPAGQINTNDKGNFVDFVPEPKPVYMEEKAEPKEEKAEPKKKVAKKGSK